MKRFISIAALVLAATACTPNPPTASNSADSNMGAAPKNVVLTDGDITAQEKSVWDSIKKKDWTTFGNMLTNDFVVVAPGATLDKAGGIKGVQGMDIADVQFSDWKFLRLGKDAAIVTYNVAVKGSANMPDVAMRATTSWVNRDGKWAANYHQESMIEKPAPGPSPTPVAESGAKPAATSAPAPATSDVIANEKQLWETLKSKNWEGFASFLADDAIEVGPNGVYDKAGSVKGVISAGDIFSRITASDYKSTKMGSDAALVTYISNIAGEKPEAFRETTVWANRGGRWLAVFHQATKVEKSGAPGSDSARK
jgi:hypothetical protein